MTYNPMGGHITRNISHKYVYNQSLMCRERDTYIKGTCTCKCAAIFTMCYGCGYGGCSWMGVVDIVTA